MRRDWALIKAILEAIEKKGCDEVLRPEEIEGYCAEEVSYHLLLLDEAGLVKAVCRNNRIGKSPFCLGYRLTWEGHELLDTMRSQSVWRRLKEKFEKGGVQLSLTAIRVMVSEVIREVMSK